MKKTCVVCGQHTADFKICDRCLHSDRITKIINDYDLDINSKKFEKVLLCLMMIERGNKSSIGGTDNG